MKRLKLLLATISVGIGVAVTYHFFEGAVHISIDKIWYGWLNTNVHRWLVMPAALVLGLVYFGVKYQLDSKTKPEPGLGQVPKPTVVNYLKILVIGYLSLVAGASLGPEAILVPACIIMGSLAGTWLFAGNTAVSKLLGGTGFVALFAAFFNSFLIGFLSIFLVAKQAKTKLNLNLAIMAAVAAGFTILTLGWLEGESYMTLPDYSWKLNFITTLWAAVLVGLGYLAVFALKTFNDIFNHLHNQLAAKSWLIKGLAAATGLAVLYWLGGPLVEFTGNNSIVPMFERATDLGIIGLLWITLVKLGVISWSKTMGYRGGLIFPSIFVAASLSAIVLQFEPDFNSIYGLIAVMIGLILADRKAKILF